MGIDSQRHPKVGGLGEMYWERFLLIFSPYLPQTKLFDLTLRPSPRYTPLSPACCCHIHMRIPYFTRLCDRSLVLSLYSSAAAAFFHVPLLFLALPRCFFEISSYLLPVMSCLFILWLERGRLTRSLCSLVRLLSRFFCRSSCSSVFSLTRRICYWAYGHSWFVQCHFCLFLYKSYPMRNELSVYFVENARVWYALHCVCLNAFVLFVSMSGWRLILHCNHHRSVC